MNQNSFDLLIKSYTLMEKPPVLELLNKDEEVVGAVYLDKLKYEQVIVSETNNSERYGIYVNGLLVYFSSFRKISE